jgi:hypothetical protein
MAEIVVRLVAGDDQERSFFLSREFASDVARLSGVVSRTPPAANPEPGQRGDPITMGAILIAAVGGGGALTALVGTIGSYLARDPTDRSGSCNPRRSQGPHLLPGVQPIKNWRSCCGDRFRLRANDPCARSPFWSATTHFPRTRPSRLCASPKMTRKVSRRFWTTQKPAVSKQKSI